MDDQTYYLNFPTKYNKLLKEISEDSEENQDKRLIYKYDFVNHKATVLIDNKYTLNGVIMKMPFPIYCLEENGINSKYVSGCMKYRIIFETTPEELIERGVMTPDFISKDGLTRPMKNVINESEKDFISELINNIMNDIESSHTSQNENDIKAAYKYLIKLLKDIEKIEKSKMSAIISKVKLTKKEIDEIIKTNN